MNVQLLMGNENNINSVPVNAGTLLYTVNGNLYVDIDDNTRIQVGDIIKITDADRTSLTDIVVNKLYFTIDTHEFYFHDGTKWNKICAEKAEKDSSGNIISSTYIKSIEISGNNIIYTKGDGTPTTKQLPSYDVMGAATSTQAGTSGLVPAPAAGDQASFLRGDGTWAIPANTDTKVTNTLNTTQKAYLTGTTSSSTNTGTQIFDTGVYLDTVAGRLVVGSLKIGSAILTYDSTKGITVTV